MHVTFSRLGAFSPKLKELRIHLCPTGETSKGVRDFIQRYYPSLRMENPNLPILVRECSGIQPRLWARFGKSREVSVPLTNQEAADVQKQIGEVGK